MEIGKINNLFGFLWLIKSIRYIVEKHYLDTFTSFSRWENEKSVFSKILSRFPFDVQVCPIELLFSEYPANEVKWVNISESAVHRDNARDKNPAWNIIGIDTIIDDMQVPHLRGKNITFVKKSHFNYSIQLKRQPRTAIVYVIFPTMAITMFNLISLLLPSGEG